MKTVAAWDALLSLVPKCVDGSVTDRELKNLRKVLALYQQMASVELTLAQTNHIATKTLELLPGGVGERMRLLSEPDDEVHA